jgi:hypothetical protein
MIDRKAIAIRFVYLAVAVFFLALFILDGMVSTTAVWMIWGVAAGLGMAGAVIEERFYLALPVIFFSLGLYALLFKSDEFGEIVGIFSISISLLSLVLWLIVEFFLRKSKKGE